MHLFHNLFLLFLRWARRGPAGPLPKTSVSNDLSRYSLQWNGAPLKRLHQIGPKVNRAVRTSSKLFNSNPSPWTIRKTGGGVNRGRCVAHRLTDTLSHTVHFHLSRLCKCSFICSLSCFSLAVAGRRIIAGLVPHKHFIDTILKRKKKTNKAQSVPLIRSGAWIWAGTLERDRLSLRKWLNKGFIAYVGGEIRRK